MKSAALCLGGLLLLAAGSLWAQNLPDAPKPQPAQKQAKFLTFRKSYALPPLRSNKQVFTGKKFLILHGAAWAATIVACKRRNSGETSGSELPAIAGVTGLDYLMSRFFTEAMSVEAPIYAIQHYWRASLK